MTGFDDESGFNVELRYLAEDIRELHRDALTCRGELRRRSTSTHALKFKISLDKLIMALIATGRYKDDKNLKKQSTGLAGVNPKITKGAYSKLFDIHQELEELIAEKGLFQKKVKAPEKI